MMYSKRNYDYFKIFFHRPIWTELNVLFWKFLSVTAVILLLLTLLSVRYYNKYPVHRIKYQLKQTYLSRIVSFYGNVEIPPPAPEEQGYFAAEASRMLLESSLMELESSLMGRAMAEETEIDMDAAGGETVSRGRRPRGSASGNAVPQITSSVKGYDPTMIAGLSGSNQTGASMRDAIGSIASAVKPSEANRHFPMEPYNTRKKAYESSVKELSRTDNNNIDIAESQFTDFDIATGMRDYEQIISTANENKKYVKHCIDRYFRNDPTFRGNMLVKFDIHPEGYVIPQSIRIVESDIKDVRVLNCIKRTIRRWRNFPHVPYELGDYSITQKYVF